MYGRPKLQQSNNTRYAIFMATYAPKDKEQPLEDIKGLNASTFLPCRRVLAEQAKSDNLIAKIIRNSMESNPALTLKGEENGWIMSVQPDKRSTFQIKWFEGEMAPTDIYKLLDIDVEQTKSNDDEDIEIQQNVDADDEIDFELDDMEL